MQTTIDFTKAEHEFGRMVKGEIPYNTEYLAELVEIEGESDGFYVEFVATCSECNQQCIHVECPECKVLYNADCILCNGSGGWFECNCNEGLV